MPSTFGTTQHASSRRLSGDQATDDSYELNSSMCEAKEVDVSFSIMRPVEASARKRSRLKISFSDQKAIIFPSGLIDGMILILPELFLPTINVPTAVVEVFC